MARPTPQLRALVVLVAATAATSALLALAGLPSPALFGALLAGLGHALLSRVPLEVPRPAQRGAQGIVGVTVGASVTLPALRALADDVLPIVAVTVATVLLSLAGGRVLARHPEVSRPTGAMAMIAGGASGVVAVARDLGADDQVVAVVQYLRVLVVLATLPVVAAIALPSAPRPGPGATPEAGAGLGADLAFVAIALGVGLLLAWLLRTTTASLLAPLAVAAVLATGGWLGEVGVPAPVQAIGFAVVGWQVGLRFTRASLSTVRRILPRTLAIIVAVLGLTAGLGGLLAWATPVDGTTAYLATTPGGLYAVLATAAGTGADLTFVVAMQLFRLLLILAVLPLVARWAARRDQSS